MYYNALQCIIIMCLMRHYYKALQGVTRDFNSLPIKNVGGHEEEATCASES